MSIGAGLDFYVFMETGAKKGGLHYAVLWSQVYKLIIQVLFL